MIFHPSPAFEALLAAKPKLRVMTDEICIGFTRRSVRVDYNGVVLTRPPDYPELLVAIDYKKLAIDPSYKEAVRWVICTQLLDEKHRNIAIIVWKRVVTRSFGTLIKGWPDRFDPDIVEWANEQFREMAEGRDYADNFRLGRIGHSTSMRAFVRQKQRGCCGEYEVVRDGPDGKRYVFGFNYGH